jgi:hypothetical protein
MLFIYLFLCHYNSGNAVKSTARVAVILQACRHRENTETGRLQNWCYGKMSSSRHSKAHVTLQQRYCLQKPTTEMVPTASPQISVDVRTARNNHCAFVHFCVISSEVVNLTEKVRWTKYARLYPSVYPFFQIFFVSRTPVF